VVTVFCCPRIATETPLNVVSFSPMTLPVTAAHFFCADEKEQMNKKEASR
jgi:hypothetical protein